MWRGSFANAIGGKFEEAGLAEESVAPPGCVIKGNISHHSGERIYHMPEQSDYEKTKIDPSREHGRGGVS